ncbi:MAG: DinB family protein [Pyrinomonadaceae bacterium]|nr:DinB family protein [Pyrinomonadaceae bacterium]
MEFDLEKALEVLRSTPAAVRALVDELSDDWTMGSGREGDWSVHDVIGHLIHADETDWIPRAEVILQQSGDRNFPPFDRFGHFEKAKGKTVGELLDEFDAVRADCLGTVAGWGLTDAELALTGIHPEFGEVTLGQLLSTWVVHDLTHIRQIATVMARKYEAEVGPWREYLSILK